MTCTRLLVPAGSMGLAAGLIACAVAAEAQSLSADWARDAVWDDGLAEVASYEATRPIYGAPRPYEAVFLTVKEDFDARTLVKADPPYGDRPILTVLKLNAVREIATPNYDYRIMTSTFVERADPSRIVKLTSGSHEWCGNTWKALRNREDRLTYRWASYFDGEGDGVQELSRSSADLLEDQLPLTLRGLRFSAGLQLELRLIPSMATTHAGPVRWRPATLTVRGKESVDVPAGPTAAWRVELRSGGQVTTYWFDAAPGHLMLRMEAPDGETLALKSVERRAYWRLG